MHNGGIDEQASSHRSTTRGEESTNMKYAIVLTTIVSGILSTSFAFAQRGPDRLLPPLEELPIERDPFQKFPTTFPLPPQQFQPVIIGPLLVSPNRRPHLKLLGGDTASIGWKSVNPEGIHAATETPSFAIAKDFRDLTGNNYIIQVKPLGIAIADIRFERPDLVFRWRPRSRRFGFAKALANCVLVVEADPLHSRAIFLRRPIKIAQAPIKLQDAATTAKYALDNLPALESLRLEVLSVAGRLPTYFINEDDIRFPRGYCTLNFGDGSVCQVKLGASINRLTDEMMVATSPSLHVQTVIKPLPWSVRRLTALREQHMEDQKELSTIATNVRKQLKSAKGPKRTSASKSLKSVARRQKLLTNQISLLKTVEQWTQQSGGRGSVGLRLYREVAGYEIDIAISP